jgi:hypothetical protein
MCSAPQRQPAGFQEASSHDAFPIPIQSQSSPKKRPPQACLPARPPRGSPNPVPIEFKCKLLKTLKIHPRLPDFGSNGHPACTNPRRSPVAPCLESGPNPVPMSSNLVSHHGQDHPQRDREGDSACAPTPVAGPLSAGFNVTGSPFRARRAEKLIAQRVSAGRWAFPLIEAPSGATER